MVERSPAPMISHCPLSIECNVTHTVALPTHSFFIADIINSYTEDHYLTDGLLDLKKILPFLLTMSDNSLSPGDVETVTFKCGEKNLWIDKIPCSSQAEIPLKAITEDIAMASEYLKKHNCIRRDEIEPLPEDFRGFWITSPCDIIHLIKEVYYLIRHTTISSNGWFTAANDFYYLMSGNYNNSNIFYREYPHKKSTASIYNGGYVNEISA